MTTPTLTVRGPEHAVALVPFLLGFTPAESLVALWISAGAIALTQRVDLPAVEAGGQEAFARRFIELAAHASADSCVLIVFTQADGDEPYAGLVDALADCVDERGCDLLDAIWVRAGHYTSYLCESDSCPCQGASVSQEVHDEIAASFVVAGVSTLESREALVASLQADAEAVARLDPRLVECEHDLESSCADEAGLESWRDRCIAELRQCLLDDRADDEALLTILTGLCDVRVRDTSMWHLARDRDVSGALGALVRALRAAPEGYVAPVATCAAMAAWFQGDGARASIALERALVDDPGYHLARLLLQAVQAGLPPSGWRAALAGMDEAEVRLRPAA